MKKILLLLCLAAAYAAPAQKISGFYQGTLFSDSANMTQRYELALSEYRGRITGYSYVTFIVNDTFYYGIRKVRGRVQDNNLIIEDDKMLANNFPESPAKGVKRAFTIPLRGQDSVISLEGRWRTNQTKLYWAVPGSIAVGRTADSSQSALFGHLKELNIPYQYATAKAVPPAVVKKESTKKGNTAQPAVAAVAAPLPPMERRKQLMETLTAGSDSLLLSFYDNGVVDGDSISVYVNGVPVITNTRLTSTATRKTIAFPQAETVEILLVAENLGTLPPNTGLLIIRDGANSYPVNFSADLQTNASIIIKRKQQ